jgi:hypothetical protein
MCRYANVWMCRWLIKLIAQPVQPKLRLAGKLLRGMGFVGGGKTWTESGATGADVQFIKFVLL